MHTSCCTCKKKKKSFWYLSGQLQGTLCYTGKGCFLNVSVFASLFKFVQTGEPGRDQFSSGVLPGVYRSDKNFLSVDNMTSLSYLINMQVFYIV